MAQSKSLKKMHFVLPVFQDKFSKKMCIVSFAEAAGRAQFENKGGLQVTCTSLTNQCNMYGKTFSTAYGIELTDT